MKWGVHQKFTFLEEEKEAAELEQVGGGVGGVFFRLSLEPFINYVGKKGRTL